MDLYAPETRKRIDRQVSLMLELARKRGEEIRPVWKSAGGGPWDSMPWYEQICLGWHGSLLEELRSMWRDAKHKVKFETVPDVTQCDLWNGDHVVQDDERHTPGMSASSDLLGLFWLAPDNRYASHIVAQCDGSSYTTRMNFTLLHELGHYLQKTDNGELADTAYIEDMPFEEACCNRFASLSLLPDDYLAQQLAGCAVPDAATVNKIFEDGRRSHGRKDVRVSRPAVIRRLIEKMPEGSSISLLSVPRAPSGSGKNGAVSANCDTLTQPTLQMRAWTNGTIDYDGDLTDVERALCAETCNGLEGVSGAYKSYTAGRDMLRRSSIRRTPSGGRVHAASLATSFAGYYRYMFVVMEAEASGSRGRKENQVG
ncbi:ImmA/IrrE family metallo-endopeptidase [Bifidobacterium thermophilum]|uniref:ImmA/IrrE family metallo-endopeptidase n=1 Tax=Bifidobacterium thermophilum TaxID=33905 RepID=A0A7X9NSL3_9BIFI|nr:ImmA/IrrE family metallo-endopeptidase [Bifidobacterium thermophilum]NME62870.1 ImmA/IrrE family metallo-endopeptidase [Bifidobacterium thermophilum]